MTDEPNKALPAAAESGLGAGPAAAGLAPRKGAGRPTNAERAARVRLGLSKPAAGAAPAAGSGPAGALAAPLWTAENSRPIGQLFFLVPGIATGWDGWALNDKEAAAVAEPLAQVLNAFVPAGGKYAAVTALATTLFVVGGMKFKGYREFAIERARAEKAKHQEKPLT